MNTGEQIYRRGAEERRGYAEKNLNARVSFGARA